MTRAPTLVEALLDDPWLRLDEFCRVAAVSEAWVVQHVEAGLLGVTCALPAERQTWRFDAVAVSRARRLLRLERDFDAVPELAALVADLQDEIHALRAHLRRAGLRS